MSGIWILIPAHNEEKTIGDVIGGAKRHCPDILVVDDGSVDGTGEIAMEMGAVTLRHGVNRGKGAALKTGFRWLLETGCRAVITLDGDGQHDPAEIPKFISLFMKNDSEGIIIGNRTIDRKSMPLYRAIPNRIGELFISAAARRHIEDTQSGFRLYSRMVIEGVQCVTDGFDFETEILIRAARRGFRIESIPVRTIYQDEYRTHFRPVRDFYRISIVVLKNLI